MVDVHWLMVDIILTHGWYTSTRGWYTIYTLTSGWFALTHGWFALTHGWFTLTHGWLALTYGWFALATGVFELIVSTKFFEYMWQANVFFLISFTEIHIFFGLFSKSKILLEANFCNCKHRLRCEMDMLIFFMFHHFIVIFYVMFQTMGAHSACAEPSPEPVLEIIESPNNSVIRTPLCGIG